MTLGPVDEVLHDKEVIREAHSGDGLKLEIEPFGLFLVESIPVAYFSSIVAYLAHVGHGSAEIVPTVGSLLVVASCVDYVLVFVEPVVDIVGEFLRELELREHMVPVDLVPLDLVADLQGILQHLRMVREQGRHLLLALEILLLRVAEPVGVVDVGIRREADKPVMRRTVLLADEMDVVCCDHLQVMFLGQLEEHRDIFALTLIDILRQARNLGLVQHDLEIIVVAEDFLVPFDGPVGSLHVPCQDHSRHFSGHAGGAADKVLVVLLQDFVADPRTIVHTLDMGDRDYLHQVLVAVVVLCEKDEVVIGPVCLVLELVVSYRDIYLTADDRLDIGVFLGEFVELLYSIHVAMVGDGQGRHSELLRTVEQILDRGLSVEDGILGMDMKMNKSHDRWDNR